ncbi:M10 family metallopeptidase C-terminal domain-containing protein, partial [Pseudomonas sp. MAFF 311096]
MKLSTSSSFSCYIDTGLPPVPTYKSGRSTSFGGSKKPSFTTDQAAKNLTRSGHKFHDKNNDRETVIAYRFEGGMTPAQKERAKLALQSWSDLANVKFQESAQNADGSITIRGNPGGSGGVASVPDKSFSAVSATIGTKGAESNPKLGSFFPLVTVHELGHAIGLLHPGKYNGGGGYERDAEYAEDTHARSVMSYFSERNQAGHDFNGLMPAAPMMDDVAAIQRLYGANTKTRNTDTTYGFNSNTGRDFYSLKNASDKPIFCVWDGGGEDTLDFSGFTQKQVINLNAEAFSDVGGLRGNVSIAKGVTVENAIGGKGNDTLTGNHANNRLKGGGGEDTLVGGGGADTFVYDDVSDSTPEAPDTLADFTSGVDRIDVSGLLKTAGIKGLNFGGLTGQPGDAVLTFDHKSGMGSLAVDLSGNGKADLLINSKGEIKAGDVVGGGGKPDEPKPDPEPNPNPKPNPKPGNLDTTYGFNSTSGQPDSSLTSPSDKPRFKVTDEGGIDTLDFSGFSQNQIIDLHAGSSSDVGGMNGNVSIDASTTVENAIGGTGNDLLIGNHVSNRLQGGGGADKLWGGGGADIFVYDKISDSTPDRPDLLMDFSSGEDKIDVTRLMCEAGIKKLDFVDRLSGKAGEAVLSFESKTGMGSLGIDLTGDGKVDLLVKTLSEIKPSDVVGHEDRGTDPAPEPDPAPT